MSRTGVPCVSPHNHKSKRREPNPIKEHVEEGWLVVRVSPSEPAQPQKQNICTLRTKSRRGDPCVDLHSHTKKRGHTNPN